MEIKKSKKADLERQRLTGFLLGLAISVSLFITALEFNSGAPQSTANDLPLDNLVKDLAIPAVDEQDREASKPQTNMKNEIAAPTETDETTVQRESADEVKQEANSAEAAQAGLSDQQLTTIKEAAQAEEAQTEPQEKIVATPPAPLDPVEPAAATSTNLPVPPGGWAEFNKWMGETLKYPKGAERRKLKGELVLGFIVNADGTLSDIKIVKPANELFNQEALRVAALMKDWKPGYKAHKPCRTYMELPIAFHP